LFRRFKCRSGETISHLSHYNIENLPGCKEKIVVQFLFFQIVVKQIKNGLAKAAGETVF